VLERFRDRLFRGEWRESCDADWAALAPARGDAIMTADLRDRFHAKQNRSIARWVLGNERTQLTVYLKRHYKAPWPLGWLAAIWPWRHWSPAWREAKRHLWAAANGFRVPRVVAVGERVGPHGQLHSYLALKELTEMTALHEAIALAAAALPPATFCRWKRRLTIALAQLVARLHQLHYFHRDLYLCHFFVPDSAIHTPLDTSTGDIAMIDLHRLTYHPFSAAWWRLKDLAQLLYSSNVDGVGARDRLRFARYYAGRYRRSWTWRALRWLISVRWRNYERHNRNRRIKRAA
jgi:heptose I phosphotransferase